MSHDGSRLTSKLALHDVEDVEAFVIATLAKWNVPEHEFDDLHSEGLAIMVELAEQWDGRGRFSGYASQFLPRRLTDAWHRSNRHHRLAKGEDGSREWVIGEPPDSIDRLRDLRDGDDATAPDPDEARPVLTSHQSSPDGFSRHVPTHPYPSLAATSAFARNVAGALDRTVQHETELALRVAVFTAAGMPRREIEQALHLSGSEVRHLLDRLRRCAHELAA